MTIRDLVEMAERKGYSLDTVIHPLGADVKYVAFGRYGEGIEYVVLDEEYLEEEVDCEEV